MDRILSTFFRRCVRPLTAAVSTLGIAACASVAVSHVTLPPPAPAALIEDAATSPSLRLRAVSLPPYLEGDRMVLENEGTRMRRAERAAWAGSLAAGVKRTLRDALAQRLGAARVRAERDERAAEAELSVDFVALDPAHDRLQLDAIWLMTCHGTGGGVLGRVWLEVPLDRQTPKAIAAATSEALSELADELAPLLHCEGTRAGLLAGESENQSEKGAPWFVAS
jgi:uncharacterized lipoprotein YmbA